MNFSKNSHGRDLNGLDKVARVRRPTRLKCLYDLPAFGSVLFKGLVAVRAVVAVWTLGPYIAWRFHACGMCKCVKVLDSIVL